MKKYLTLVAVFLFSAAFSQKWQPLFNGKDLSGWRQLGGAAKYEVKNGEILGITVANTPNSFLATDKEYGDFIFEVEVKLDSPANSGIQFRSESKAAYQKGKVFGYQMEIDPSLRGWSGGVYDESRNGWLYPMELNQKNKITFKAGQWYKYRIECIGSNLKTFINGRLMAQVIDNTTSRGRTIRFLFDGNHEEMMQAIYELGETPIPKDVLQREVEEIDNERFQTIFAEVEGAVAAPTAGIHFTKNIMRRMEINGVDFAPLTLHIGIGTFRQVEVEDLTKHKTDSENFFINQETCNIVNAAIDNSKRICSIGSTALRAMESSVSANDRLKPIDNAWTDKFIFPPFDFKISNALLTNFHLPESILFMTTCAFGGYDTITEAYQVAIKEKYRFFTYGDAMLII